MILSLTISHNLNEESFVFILPRKVTTGSVTPTHEHRFPSHNFLLFSLKRNKGTTIQQAQIYLKVNLIEYFHILSLILYQRLLRNANHFLRT